MCSIQDGKYLGLDFSTQQLKGLVINNSLEVTNEATVQFDIDLPEFKTQGGVHRHEDKLTVTAPTIMWVKALDILLERFKSKGLDFATVLAISGSAQQHGSVYWKKGAQKIFAEITSNKFLHEQLQSCFSVSNSPVWMDSSTFLHCQHLENAVGGPVALANITGSRAYERFTGNQIAKIYNTQPELYDNTERISLVSSFAATLFLGKYAPIDWSDGSGMNLLDIYSKEWSDICLKNCAPNLKEKLGLPQSSLTDLGTISTYFVKRYDFNPKCKIIAFTGDNPASLAGLNLKKDEIAVSLGTSDTMFLWITEPAPSAEGHILCNPVDDSAYMALLCFKNGSLTRERIRDACAEGLWQLFSDLLESSPKGNSGHIGLYFDHLEITPRLCGDFRFDKYNERVHSFANDVEVRAVIEGQFLSKRVHAENLGYRITKDSKIIATGGASVNKAIVQILSDIFDAPVYVHQIVNSACLGAAYRAKLVLATALGSQLMIKKAQKLRLAAEPDEGSRQIYDAMTRRYKLIEAKLRA